MKTLDMALGEQCMLGGKDGARAKIDTWRNVGCVVYYLHKVNEIIVQKDVKISKKFHKTT